MTPFMQTEMLIRFKDTWMQPWGERYVEGYKAGLDGKRRIDGIFANL